MFAPIYLKILFHNKRFDVLFLTQRNYMVIKTKTAIKKIPSSFWFELLLIITLILILPVCIYKQVTFFGACFKIVV